MSDTKTKKPRVWTVDEAKINLPYILGLAETEGTQYIGTPQRPFEIKQSEPIADPAPPPMPLGKWAAGECAARREPRASGGHPQVEQADSVH